MLIGQTYKPYAEYITVSIKNAFLLMSLQHCNKVLLIWSYSLMMPVTSPLMHPIVLLLCCYTSHQLAAMDGHILRSTQNFYLRHLIFEDPHILAQSSNAVPAPFDTTPWNMAW